MTKQVALVTGVSSGIGRITAQQLVQAGFRVFGTLRSRDQAPPPGVEAAIMDVRDDASVRAAVDDVIARAGRIDVLVNNAGGTLPRAALQTSERFFEAALRFNVTSAFLLSRLVVPKMVETAGGGAIVNVSSRSSDMVQPSFVAYGAAKAALNMMTRNLAAEVAPKVRVNAISVGGVATEALTVVLTNDELRAQFEANTPMGRPGTVEDIAACALYLASPAGGWVTGKIFQVDGGTESPAITLPVTKL